MRREGTHELDLVLLILEWKLAIKCLTIVIVAENWQIKSLGGTQLPLDSDLAEQSITQGAVIRK